MKLCTGLVFKGKWEKTGVYFCMQLVLKLRNIITINGEKSCKYYCFSSVFFNVDNFLTKSLSLFRSFRLFSICQYVMQTLKKKLCLIGQFGSVVGVEKMAGPF